MTNSLLFPELFPVLTLSDIPDTLHVLFKTTMREDLDKLKHAIMSNDSKAIKASAHRMKGAFQVLSLHKAVQVCEYFESMAVMGFNQPLLQEKMAAFYTYLQECIDD